MKKKPSERRNFSYLKQLRTAVNDPAQRLTRPLAYSSRSEETMVFIEPARYPPTHPPLDFRPPLLRSYTLVPVLTFFLAVESAIVVLLYCNRKHRSLHYSANLTHVAVRYIPMAVGQIITILWAAIRDNLGRITPYMSMAAPRSADRSINPRWARTIGAAYFPRMNFDLHSGHWLYLAIFASNIPVHSIPALQSVLLNSTPDRGGWTIQVSSPVAYSLILIYSSLCCLTITLLLRLWNRYTGLKWDPGSIADQIAFLHKSNVRRDFDNLETASRDSVRSTLANHTYRLGYWEKGIKKRICYGIASELERPVASDAIKTNPDLKNYNPRREVYWQVSKSTMGIAIVTAGCAAAAAIFVRSARTRYQEFHITTSLTRAHFLFQALPTFLSQLFTYFWSHVDTFHRSTQPFVGMYEKSRRASESILLDYLCKPPVVITINAVRKGHWKVAYFSSLSLASNVLPPLVGTLFTTTRSGSRVTVMVDIQTLSYVAAILLIYCISIPIAWPTRNRKLPRNVDSPTDLFCFCYASQLLDDPALDLDNPNYKREDFVQALHQSRKKYRFGFYRGTDKRKHLGIHLEREGTG